MHPTPVQLVRRLPEVGQHRVHVRLAEDDRDLRPDVPVVAALRLDPAALLTAGTDRNASSLRPLYAAAARRFAQASPSSNTSGVRHAGPLSSSASQRTPLRIWQANRVSAFDAQDVEGLSGHRDRGAAVEHAQAEQREVRPAVQRERGASVPRPQPRVRVPGYTLSSGDVLDGGYDR